jgi:Mitochondrial carrier protein
VVYQGMLDCFRQTLRREGARHCCLHGVHTAWLRDTLTSQLVSSALPAWHLCWSECPPFLFSQCCRTCGTGCAAGVRGLYKGLLPDMAKIAPAAAISWTVFERGAWFATTPCPKTPAASAA